MTPTASNYELPFDAPMPPSPDLRDCAALLSILDAWVARGWLRRLDRAFARFLYDCEPGTDPQVAVAAALASHQLGHGHVCLDLASTLQNPDEALSLPPEGESALAMRLPSDVLRGLDLPAWRNALADSPLVDVIGEGREARGGSPLVLDGQRLYLRRYWDFERRIAAALRRRLQQPPFEVPGLAQALTQLFGPPADRPDWQKLACAIAARGSIGIVTGGRERARPRPWCVCWPCCNGRRPGRAGRCASCLRRPPARRPRAFRHPSANRWGGCRYRTRYGRPFPPT